MNEILCPNGHANVKREKKETATSYKYRCLTCKRIFHVLKKKVNPNQETDECNHKPVYDHRIDEWECEKCGKALS